MSTPKILGVPVNFRKISFLIRALLLWEKVATEEKKKREKQGKKRKEKENTDENSGHYVIASSRPADRWNALCTGQNPPPYSDIVIFQPPTLTHLTLYVYSVYG